MSSVRAVALTCAATLLAACSESPSETYDAGVPRNLAERRSQTISNLRYEISFDIPASSGDAGVNIRGSEKVTFSLADTRQPVVLDFAQPATNLFSVSVNGRAAEHELVNEHVILPAELFRVGANSVEIDFRAGDGSLNRNDDFLYTLFVPDRARVALPLFDQPGLKGRFRLSLDVPSDWTAVSNGELSNHNINGDRARFEFAETQPISTYLFSFVAGRFETESAERDGRKMTFLHRETDADKVARNREAIFDLHAAALRWLEAYTEIPYPFEKFDFVLIPSFQYGGMEHPGAILYRGAGLMLDESATQNHFLGRASVIAHETAHMWFGNLVTMKWFDDVWMKEVFSNFMAAKIVNPSFPDVDHDLRFLLAHYPAAYGVDRTEGANAIRQELSNLNEAGSLYGAIIYQKAPIVMKHLELLMGEEPFRDGLREYLARYRFGNATWPDLIEILDGNTEEDLAAWSQVWVDEPSRPTITTSLETEGPTVAALSISQKDPEGRGRHWNQRLEVLLGYRDRAAKAFPAHLKEDAFAVTEAAGEPAPDYVLPNGIGIGYGYFELDERSREYLLNNLPSISSSLTRAVAWLSLWEAMLDGAAPPLQMIELILTALETETDELNTERLLAYLRRTFWAYLDVDQREALAPRIEAQLWRSTQDAPRETLKAAYFATYRRVSLSAEALARLQRIWEGEETVPGLSLSERDDSALAQELALREVEDAETILQQQLERIENPDWKERFRFTLPSLSMDPRVRDRFFESLEETENREHEPWVLDAVRFLHHPLRAEEAETYIRPSLDLLEELQRTGDIFFPKAWLDVTLGGHSSPAAAAIVRAFLEQRTDLSPRLRQKLLQAADPLFRAAKSKESRPP